MSEELIVRHCSPTLAGIKTAGAFSCSYRSEEELRREIRRLNRKLVRRGLRIVPLRIRDGKALISVYRPDRLQGDLLSAEAERLLRAHGYEDLRADRSVVRLAERLRDCDGFPHEIGLFLGYPPEDVAGFIENGAKGYKLCGAWKVYGDEEQARLLFARYKKCTDVYLRHWSLGRPIERLTVCR